jgi:hypothetical protein
VVPHTSIDTEAHWTKSGWHGWVYGWKLHLVNTVASVWIPLAAELPAANTAGAIFDCQGQVPTRGLIATRRHVLAAVLVYQLVLLHRFQPHRPCVSDSSHACRRLDL